MAADQRLYAEDKLGGADQNVVQDGTETIEMLLRTGVDELG
jgi:hypothetical protein